MSRRASDIGSGPFLALTRHEEFYLNGGDLFFLLENVQFRVHRYFFERESSFFRGKLTTPASPGASKQGTSDSTALMLEGVQPAEFAKFLWVFYNPKYSLYNAPVEDWTTILTLAHRWAFPEVKALAVREMEQIDIPNIDRIVVYHENDVDRNLLIPRYAALCEREEPLSLPEGLRLGMETTLMIARAREYARANPTANGARSPSASNIRGNELQNIVRELFGIAPSTAVADEEPAPNSPGGLQSTSSVPLRQPSLPPKQSPNTPTELPLRQMVLQKPPKKAKPTGTQKKGKLTTLQEKTELLSPMAPRTPRMESQQQQQQLVSPGPATSDPAPQSRPEGATTEKVAKEVRTHEGEGAREGEGKIEKADEGRVESDTQSEATVVGSGSAGAEDSSSMSNGAVSGTIKQKNEGEVSGESEAVVDGTAVDQSTEAKADASVLRPPAETTQENGGDKLTLLVDFNKPFSGDGTGDLGAFTIETLWASPSPGPESLL